MAQDCINVMEGEWSPVEVIRDIVDSGTQEEPFYVMDLGEVVARYRRWNELMPRVQPFYVMSCNDNKHLVSTLVALGTGFVCSTKGEIELVTSVGVEPNRIIFANPAKMFSHIRYSSVVGVDYMTFDSQSELDKIEQHMPHAQLVLRIRFDAKCDSYALHNKFGCDPISEAPDLLRHAAAIKLDVVGVSFHVGSDGIKTKEIYARGIEQCRKLFEVGASLGHMNMHLLDLGGGFPGTTNTDIYEVSQVINSALQKHFPDNDVRVIAEPGRYFAAAPFTLATCVYSMREIIPEQSNAEGEVQTMYFISDGVYGSFSRMLQTAEELIVQHLYPTPEPSVLCTVWGPTLDSVDCVLPRTRLPPLRVGDWLVFRDMGAYTLTLATTFNSLPVPKVWSYVNSEYWSVLKGLHPLMCVKNMSKKHHNDSVQDLISA